MNQPGLSKQILTAISVAADTITVVLVVAKFTTHALVLVLVALAATTAAFSLFNWVKSNQRINVLTLAVISFVSLALWALSWAWLANTRVRPIDVEITDPQDGKLINGDRYLVRGHVSDPAARVYLLVHPVNWTTIWVQDTPIVDRSGDWQVDAYIGEETLGMGQKFELIAVGTDDNFLVALATGNILFSTQRKTIPQNTNKSKLLTVTRIRSE